MEIPFTEANTIRRIPHDKELRKRNDSAMLVEKYVIEAKKGKYKIWKNFVLHFSSKLINTTYPFHTKLNMPDNATTAYTVDAFEWILIRVYA